MHSVRGNARIVCGCSLGLIAHVYGTYTFEQPVPKAGKRHAVGQAQTELAIGVSADTDMDVDGGLGMSMIIAMDT